jgi:hypothetical protein
MGKRLELLIFIVAILLLNSCRCIHQEKIALKAEKSSYAEALAYAKKHLPKNGTLVQQDDGYAYLKVDDRYIHELFLKLDAQTGYKEPPYFRRKDAPGAHISIVYGDEKVKLKEVGQNFSFSLKNIAVVHPHKGTSYIILQVDAPELEQLRKRYGLGPKLKGHEFHISIAKKTE